MSVDLTILICTHNRAGLLAGALESLEEQSLSRERFEVIVVDNASADDTSAVVARCQARGRIAPRYVLEPELGLDAARNRGIREAAGDLVAFLDDDARARYDWAASILAGFELHDAPILGGRVELIWEIPRPAWFSDVLLRYLIHLDYGPQPLEVTSPPWLYGTNVAFRKSLFQELGLFRLDLDRKGDSLMGGGDTEFFVRARSRGRRLQYLPTIVVRHLAPASRLTRKFFRERLFFSGYTRAAHGTESAVQVALNCLVFLAGSPLCFLAAAGWRLLGKPGRSFAQERRALLGAGYLYYWMKRAAGRVPPPRQEAWT
ncbi:MAG TPA: glycosyltransferase [Candidatus Polarisedimenticolia bacterium]|jgi:glycosyltransferase involved in cell wall biosynthesis|nr:glycosyltransferase [Candidatus Polarisedimenticolia bacterium]